MVDGVVWIGRHGGVFWFGVRHCKNGYTSIWDGKSRLKLKLWFVGRQNERLEKLESCPKGKVTSAIPSASIVGLEKTDTKYIGRARGKRKTKKTEEDRVYEVIGAQLFTMHS